MRRFVAEYVQPEPGMRVLDIGCGRGEIVRLMPGVEYVGFDRNPRYIDIAQRQFGDLGEFHCMDVVDADLDDQSFDAVIAWGIFHHLDDSQADHLTRLAVKFLKPSGRLLTGDSAQAPETGRIARWLLSKDRGRAIRTPEGYAELHRKRFRSVEPSLMRVPLPLVRARFPIGVVVSRDPV
jgi:cyclopropane fatty-acyl-phospholipid synthase-like methyltransferase